MRILIVLICSLAVIVASLMSQNLFWASVCILGISLETLLLVHLVEKQ